MTWLLDTNVVSEPSRPQPDPHCLAWLDARAEDCDPAHEFIEQGYSECRVTVIRAVNHALGEEDL